MPDQETAPKISVGYIGLGTMGEPMARNVLAAGFHMSVYDIHDTAMARLVEAGAVGQSSPRDLAAHADVILINVVNDTQVEQVMCDPDTGIVGALRKGSVVVVHSTVHPDCCVRLAKVAAQFGAGLIDAPFTGGMAAARDGTLSLLVGGDARSVEAASSVLGAEGSINHLGAVGTGQLAKLGNNLVLGITTHAVHEALRLATCAGLDADVMLQVLTNGAGDCWAARNWAAMGRMAAVYPGGCQGLGTLTRKDMALALKVAQDHGVSLPIAANAAENLEYPYQAALSFVEGREESPRREDG